MARRVAILDGHEAQLVASSYLALWLNPQLNAGVLAGVDKGQCANTACKSFKSYRLWLV
jgi:hypothetical protein